jgi:hypothetical protein
MFGAGDPGILEFIRTARPEYLWLVLPEGENLAGTLVASDYRIDTQTGQSMIMVRSDLPPLDGSPLSSCFP